MRDVPGLKQLFDDQTGLATRSPLRNLGVTENALRWALSHGWRAVLPSVVSSTKAGLSPRQRLVAALLHAGDGAMIAATTAAEWHGVTAAAGDSRVHVLVPDTRHPRSSGFVVVARTRRPDERSWSRGALTISSRPRAVVDAARSAAATSDQSRAIILEAVERRLVLPDDLRHEVEAGPRPGSGVVRRAVEEAEAGAWSLAEGDLMRLVSRSRVLPPVWANPTLTTVDGLRLPTPDAWIDAVGLAIQVHSRRWHSGYLDWEGTVMADGVFAEHGIPLVAVTPVAIRTAPREVLARIERACAAAAERPRAPVIARRAGQTSVA